MKDYLSGYKDPTENAREKVKSVLSGVNPFTDKNGQVRNPYIDYQKLLDSGSVNTRVKQFITDATGLTPTQTAPVREMVQANQISQITGKPTRLGYVSAKYETGGYNGGLVSSGKGDYGGISYGVPQFSTKTGSADSFVSWLKTNRPDMGQYFGNAKAGTGEFSNAWKNVYAKFGDDFSEVQSEYAFNNFAKPLAALAKAKTGVDYTRSPALKELLYSTAVQFGGGKLGLSALGKVSAGMSDRDIINASYDEKIKNYNSYFKSSSQSVRESVKNRFINERNDVLSMIGNTDTPSTANKGTLQLGKKIANTSSYNNNAALGQCVWYVRGRMKEKFGKDWGSIGNANEVYYNAPDRAKLSARAENIKADTVASFKKSPTGSKYGHVIYIEAVDGDNVYYTEGGSSYHQKGTDGVLKKTTKQALLNGSGSFGSGLVGLIDIQKI